MKHFRMGNGIFHRDSITYPVQKSLVWDYSISVILELDCHNRLYSCHHHFEIKARLWWLHNESVCANPRPSNLTQACYSSDSCTKPTESRFNSKMATPWIESFLSNFPISLQISKNATQAAVTWFYVLHSGLRRLFSVQFQASGDVNSYTMHLLTCVHIQMLYKCICVYAKHVCRHT